MSCGDSDNFAARVYAFIDQEGLLSSSSRPLLAVSGGRDSMCLLDLLRRRWQVAVAHFNFQLRGEESFRDEAFLRDYCARYHLPFHLRREDTHAWCAAHHLSTQVGCRELRYCFFEELRQAYGYTEVVIAHHADDRAETLLLNLVRGTGLRGLGAMRPRHGDLVRPLLVVTRREIDEYVSAHQLAYRDDSSNATNKYTRNFLRHEVLPLLASVNSSATEHIAQTAILSSESYEILRTEAIALWGEIDVYGDFSWEYHTALTASHLGLSRFWLRERLLYYGFSQQSVDIALDVFPSSEATGRYVESAGWRATYDRGVLHVVERGSGQATEFPELRMTEELVPEGLSDIDLKRFANRDPWIAVVDAASFVSPLRLRPWQSGDSFTPLGMGGRSKKVSDFLTDLRYPSHRRSEVLVLEDATGVILWVVGLRLSERVALRRTTRRAVCLSVSWKS